MCMIGLLITVPWTACISTNPCFVIVGVKHVCHLQFHSSVSNNLLKWSCSKEIYTLAEYLCIPVLKNCSLRSVQNFLTLKTMGIGCWEITIQGGEQWTTSSSKNIFIQAFILNVGKWEGGNSFGWGKKTGRFCLPLSFYWHIANSLKNDIGICP